MNISTLLFNAWADLAEALASHHPGLRITATQGSRIVAIVGYWPQEEWPENDSEFTMRDR